MPTISNKWKTERWYKSRVEGSWAIRFENPEHGNFLGNIPNEDVVDFIIEMHNSKFPVRAQRIDWRCLCGTYNSIGSEDPPICWKCQAAKPVGV